MATFRKRGKSWYAEVSKNGVRMSKSFDTKAKAVAWATQVEADLANQKAGAIPDKTFGELLERYAEEVSVHKKSYAWEHRKIEQFRRMDIADVKLTDLSDVHFIQLRDRRIKDVSPATVNRDFSLLSHVCTKAHKEWKWLRDNPVVDVQRPKQPPPRDRRISQDEIDRILLASGYTTEHTPNQIQERVGAAFIFAIETAMRAGEIVKLRWTDIVGRVAKLTDTKNGRPRQVPLSPEALRILDQLPKDAETAFNLTSGSLDAVFRKIKNRCGIEDLHFHDTRHEAITRLSRKLDVLALARMVGHTDLRMLQVYYNATAEELADRLS